MPPKFIARQLSCPSGFFAPIIGWLMNRHNAKLNAFAIGQLELSPVDRVLEIGFGGGLNLPFLLAHAGYVAGMDRSRAVVNQATARFRDAVKTGRATFVEGNVHRIPFENASFTRVCTVNTVYFWASLDQGFAEIYRVLSPGGRAFVGFLPRQHMEKMGMPPDIFTMRTEDDVVTALERNKFIDVHLERPTPSTAWAVAVATR